MIKDLETVIGFAHDGQSCLNFLVVKIRNKYAVALVASSANTASELVKLA